MMTATCGQDVKDKVPNANAITPVEALKRLMDGNARYVEGKPNERDFSCGRAARAKSQHPIAAILSCADSRLAPEFAFDQKPGDLFVMRVAGNVMSPNLLASLEYAVGVDYPFLGVPLVMVLGHTNCGAVNAAINVRKDANMSAADLSGHLPELISEIEPAVIVSAIKMAQTAEGKVQTTEERAEILLDNAVEENVRQQVAQLKKSSPVIEKLYTTRRINIVGGVYHLKTGKVELI